MMEMSREWSDEEVEVEAEEQEQEFEEAATESEDEPDELGNDEIEVDEAEYTDECAVDVTHFDFIKQLGSGAYGTVFLVKKNCGIDIDQIYALKVISKYNVIKAPKTIIHMKAERKALELLRQCPYIQTLYYAFQTVDKLFLVTEYLPGGEMFSQVQKSAMPEDKVRFYIAELIVALEYIHMHGIVYRDIKLENIMLDVDGHVKLVDFGLCKKLGPSGRSKSFCGTEEYMAPEIVTCTGHNSAADWWALGVLAIELLSTVTPFGNSDGPNTTMEKITKEDPVMPSDISEEMEDFLLQLLNKDPNERLGGCEPSASKIKEHRLFDDIDWEKLEKKQLPAPDAPPRSHPFDVQNFSPEFTSLSHIYTPSEPIDNSFVIFKGYSYVAPELDPTLNFVDSPIDENWNSLTRHILSNRDPESKFHEKYVFASHQPLSSGKSSVCMKCYNLIDSTYYAVKIYSRTNRNNDEIDLLKKAAAQCLPGVLHLVEVLTDARWTYLVMELIEDSVDMLDGLGAQTSLNGRTIYQVLDTLWSIIKNVHTLKYSHGRICFKNIRYIPKNAEFRLIGFSSAKPIVDAQDEQIDYWSLGVCIYTLLCGHSPFKLTRSAASTNRIRNGDFDQKSNRWTGLHSDVKSFIHQLLRNPIPTCSSDELEKFKNIAVRSVTWSKELIDENKTIVEIRASKLKIKAEPQPSANDIEPVVTNGNGCVHDDNSSSANTNGRLHQNESPDHAEMNGHAAKPSSKRRIDKTNEEIAPVKSKKFKNQNQNISAEMPVKVEDIKPERRNLRNGARVDYAKKNNDRARGKKNLAQQKPSVPDNPDQSESGDVKDVKFLRPEPKERKAAPKNVKAPARGKGRPRKEKPSTAEPPKPPTVRRKQESTTNATASTSTRPVQQNRSTGRKAFMSHIVVSSVYKTETTTVHFYRPPRPAIRGISSFLRFDYK